MLPSLKTERGSGSPNSNAGIRSTCGITRLGKIDRGSEQTRGVLDSLGPYSSVRTVIHQKSIFALRAQTKLEALRERLYGWPKRHAMHFCLSGQRLAVREAKNTLVLAVGHAACVVNPFTQHQREQTDVVTTDGARLLRELVIDAVHG